jgi:hypothetical protein
MRNKPQAPPTCFARWGLVCEGMRCSTSGTSIGSSVDSGCALEARLFAHTNQKKYGDNHTQYY